MLPKINEWFAPKSHPPFEHPTLGTFAFEDDIWSSRIQGIEVSVAGNGAAPNEALLAAASALLERLAEVKNAALDFLVSQDGAPEREDFSCYDLELLQEDSPGHFALRFILLGDLGGIWRVEFEDGVPLFLNRDE